MIPLAAQNTLMRLLKVVTVRLRVSKGRGHPLPDLPGAIPLVQVVSIGILEQILVRQIPLPHQVVIHRALRVNTGILGRVVVSQIRNQRQEQTIQQLHVHSQGGVGMDRHVYSLLNQPLLRLPQPNQPSLQHLLQACIAVLSLRMS